MIQRTRILLAWLFVTVRSWTWMLPNNLAGLAISRLGRCWPAGSYLGAREFVAYKGGPLAWFFHNWGNFVGVEGGFAAATIGEYVFYRNLRDRNQARRIHEHVHVRQQRLLGFLALVAYPLASLWALARGGHAYRDNWFERQARGEV